MKLLKSLQKLRNENGIRYSSVFEPIELFGGNTILTLNGEEYGNYALTEH